MVKAIGIGFGTGEQDVIVAQAGIDALSAAIASLTPSLRDAQGTTNAQGNK